LLTYSLGTLKNTCSLRQDQDRYCLVRDRSRHKNKVSDNITERYMKIEFTTSRNMDAAEKQ